jgi:hypothetical protein
VPLVQIDLNISPPRSHREAADGFLSKYASEVRTYRHPLIVSRP